LRAQEAGITVALANLAVAQAELVKDAQESARYDRIYREDPGALSVRRLEVARASRTQSEARVRAAAAQVEQARAARGDNGDANDRLIAARSALERANLDLGRTTVVAPGDGLVTDLKTDIGTMAGAGNGVMTFIAVHDGWVTADLTENNIGLVVPGQKVECVLDAFPGTILTGRVRSLGYGVASGGKSQPGSLPDVQNNRDFLRQAQRFPVIIEFDRDQLASLRGLREGGQAEVIIYTGDHPVMNALGRLYIRIMGYLSYAY
jgi:multidrug resistance efflux pump